MNGKNTGNCSVLGPKLPVLSRLQEKCCRLGQNLSESLSSPRLPRYCLGCCHSHWLRQILQTIKHEASQVWSQDRDNNGFLIVILHSELRDSVLNMIRHQTKIHVTSLCSHSLATPEWGKCFHQSHLRARHRRRKANLSKVKRAPSTISKSSFLCKRHFFQLLLKIFAPEPTPGGWKDAALK